MSNAMPHSACPVCHSCTSVPFLRRPRHFLSIFLADEKVPDIDVEFVFCPDCCHIYLRTAYSDPGYKDIAHRLYQRYALLEQAVRPFPQRDRHYLAAVEFFRAAAQPGDASLAVLEIGSNRGDFLHLLREALPNITVQGVEPSALPFHGVPTINTRFEECDFSRQFDAVIARHVVEHLESPHDFMAKVSRALKPEGVLFLEVPNLHYDLPRGIENFIPEHVHHFSQRSLRHLLAGADLHPTYFDDTRPEGLRLLARKIQAPLLPETCPAAAIDRRHIDGYAAKIDRCIRRFTQAMRDGYRPVFYGFGNVFFCVLAELLKHLPRETFHAASPVIIDDTPSKIGRRFRDIPVLAPEEGLGHEATVVIICTMNPTHKQLMREKAARLAPGRLLQLAAWDETLHE